MSIVCLKRGACASTLTLARLNSEAWAPTARDPLSLPEAPGHLGRYALLSELGRGAMSVVYEARDERGHRLALKLASTESGLRALDREARALTRAGAHPDLVNLRACSSEGDRRTLALDLVEGQPLDFLLGASGSLPAHLAARALAPVARAVAHLHARGIVHRDVKPANLLIRPDGRGLLLDLGLACTSDRPERDGHAAGTPAYMPAEQLCGVRPSARGDVFALGVTLYEALTGHVPHDAPTRARLLEQRRARPVARPGLETAVPPALDELVLACLSARPRSRPTARQVADTLERVSAPILRPFDGQQVRAPRVA